jgi:hypothetical protein
MHTATQAAHAVGNRLTSTCQVNSETEVDVHRVGQRAGIDALRDD